MNISPNVAWNSPYEFTTVGTNDGPFTVGPITTAPISPTAAGKNEASISLVNTPGETIFSAIWNSPIILVINYFDQIVIFIYKYMKNTPNNKLFLNLFYLFFSGICFWSKYACIYI